MAPGSDGGGLDNLYTVILQCFVVILMGYLAGRSGLISSSQSSGIGTFVTKFCLPALLLKSMIELDFSQVNWMFLVGVLIAKGSVFLLVAGITLVVKRPTNLGYAGIFGIFCTQSNDFAVGYPILLALYGESHMDYLNYLYLIAPISLVVLNPIGFTLLEIEKSRSQHAISDSSDSGICTVISRVMKGVFTNPIVFMTFIGILGHFVCNGTVPHFLKDILEVLGNAFNASALFLLGLSMVGKIKGIMGIGLLVPILLITVKTLILPLVIWEVVGGLVEACNGTSSLSMYGFLYGTLPSAPTVFLYANTYGVAEEIVARGIVLGTFMSAPLMFGSAKMMTMAVEDVKDHANILSKASMDISIVSLVLSVWVIAVLVFGRKWRLIPHRFTLALIMSQVAACVGMVAYYHYGMHTQSDAVYYPIVIVILIGIFSARTWTAVISVIMCLLYKRSLCYVLSVQVWLWLAGFGIPVFLTGILFMVGDHTLTGPVDPTFHFGKVQAALSAVLLALCIAVTLVSVVLWQRVERQQYSLLEDQSPPLSPQTAHGSSCSPGAQVDSSSQRLNGAHHNGHVKRAPSLEDIIPSETANGARARTFFENNSREDLSERSCLLSRCTPSERSRCQQDLRSYVAQNIDTEDDMSDEFQIQQGDHRPRLSEEYQSDHHLILVLVLLLSIFVGLFMCLWRVSHSELYGIHLEIEFLDSFLIYGQGIIFLAVFGFDTKLVFSPMIRRLRQWVTSSDMVGLLRSSHQSKKTRQVCHQFNQFHRESCNKDIVKDYSTDVGIQQKLFKGTDLCHWLIQAGLAEDKEEAVVYGRNLLLGRVIAHATGTHHFQDAPYLYRFLEVEDDYDC